MISPSYVGRRLFLSGVAAGLGLIAFGGGLPAVLRSWLESPLGDLSPSDGFHFYSVTGSIPGWDRRRWRLVVDGLVESPLTMGFDDLVARRSVTVRTDFHCVTGWSVAGVRWDGLALRDLLQAAGPKEPATAVRFESADGAYVDYLDMTTARAEGVIVATHLNGAPLTAERGAPARLVVPFFYGYKGVKWLHRVTVVQATGTGYWEARGYAADARIRG